MPASMSQTDLRSAHPGRLARRCPARHLFLCGFLLGAAAPSLATTADDLCASTADPCVVNVAVAATPNSIIDVGDRELQISGNGSITVQSGTLTLRGRRIATGVNTLIRTSGPTRADPAALLEIIAEDVFLAGQIDARGSPAGDVDVTGTATLTFSGTLRGRTEAADASASAVTMIGSTVFLGGSIELDGGREDTGGDLSVAGGAITLAGSIVVAGGDGGTLDVSATESLIVTAAASASANATTAAGDGGDISLDSDEVLEIRGQLTANGRTGGDEGGGDGGQIILSGDGGAVMGVGASVASMGGSPDGLAGDIELTSLFGSVEMRGSLLAESAEREGVGGTIDVSADGSIILAGNVRARGALGGAGDIEIDAGTFVTVAQGALVEASATREAVAGTVSLAAGSFIEIGGSILAETTVGTVNGGSLTIDACVVTMSNTAILRSSGLRAANVITAAGAMTVRGVLTAGSSQSSNTLRYPEGGPIPNTTGANISPPPMLVADGEIIPCQPLPATPTPSFTPTPSPTATPTETVVPPDCAGDCDGNGAVSIAELIRAVNIALEITDVANCRAADVNGDGRVTIAELIRAVGSALDGCGG